LVGIREILIFLPDTQSLGNNYGFTSKALLCGTFEEIDDNHIGPTE
jgi:hypothetical protein